MCVYCGGQHRPFSLDHFNKLSFTTTHTADTLSSAPATSLSSPAAASAAAGGLLNLIETTDAASINSAGASTSAASINAASFASIPTLANFLVNGYWQYNNALPHSWAGTTISVNMTDLSASEQSMAQAALIAWQDVCGVSFTLTTGAAHITYINDGSGTAVCYANWNGAGQMTGATVQISSDWSSNGYFYQTYIHETGHALGLGHQGPYNGSATYGVDNIYTNDTWQWSVMSYNSQSNFGGASNVFVVTPQMADIYAVQALYGAETTRTGNTTYGFNSNAGWPYDFTQYSAAALTIYDSGGIDTLDCSGYTYGQAINLNPGTWSSIGGYVNNIAIYLTTVVENAVGGSGSDSIIGNDANNALRGRGGNDNINGGLGTDSAVFAGLRSAYTLTNLGGGSVRVSGPDGTDTLSGVEWLIFDDQTINWGANTAPVATISDHILAANQWSQVAGWISYSDAEGTAATQYQFWDGGTGTNSGYFWTPGNAHHPADTAITVAASDLNNVWIRGGQTAGSETMWVRAFDGTNWSNWDSFTFATTANTPPVVAAGDHGLSANQWSQVAGWISYSDAEGTAATQYQFWDGGTGANSGYFWTPGNAHHPADTAITVAAADLNNVWVRGGQTAGSETMWVRAFDGTNWSNWDSFTLLTA